MRRAALRFRVSRCWCGRLLRRLRPPARARRPWENSHGLSCRFVTREFGTVFIAIGAVAASRSAAVAALEVIGRGEHEIGPLEIVVLRIETGRSFTRIG